MAKAPKKKQSDPKKPSAIQLQELRAFEKRLAAAEAAFPEKEKERLRPKTYQDFLAYAQQFNDFNASKIRKAEFPTPLSISAQDAFSPYYGSDYEQQQAAAAEYAKRLAMAEANSKPVVRIDPKYYEELQRKVPVERTPFSAYYDIENKKINIPTPIDMADQKMSYTDQELAANNWVSQKDLAKAFLTKLGDSYRDTLEHEAGHIADRYVQFAKTNLDAPDQRENWPKFHYGYMGQEHHLVTGLGKVQRELYAKTGARIESPDQFKQFVFDLAKSENIEEAISGFSEEAKRSLRPQIKNAKEVQDYYNQLDISKKSWFKIAPAIPRKQLDFLEKSALLIPGLVQTGTRNKSSV